MKIYSFPTFNLTKVLFTAEELELDYQLELLDVMKGEHKMPEHLARHPLGKVPVVELNGTNYFETAAIARLLAELNDNQLYANSPEERAVINEWLDMSALHLGRWFAVFFWEERIKKVLGLTASEAALSEAEGFLAEQLPVYDQRLSTQDYLAGDTLSIADIVAFSHVHTHELTSVNLDGFTNIQSWYQRVKARPAFERAMNRVGGNMFDWLG